jgi:hypothetical protein
LSILKLAVRKHRGAGESKQFSLCDADIAAQVATSAATRMMRGDLPRCRLHGLRQSKFG